MALSKIDISKAGITGTLAGNGVQELQVILLEKLDKLQARYLILKLLQVAHLGQQQAIV